MNSTLLWSVTTFISTILVCVGVYKNKIETLSDRIADLEARDKATEVKLTEIQCTLSDISAKIGLLLKDKTLL